MEEDSFKKIVEKINLPIAIIISVILILLFAVWSEQKEKKLSAECSDLAIEFAKETSGDDQKDYNLAYDTCIKSGGKDNFMKSLRGSSGN